MVIEMSIVEVAEECLKNSLLRNGYKITDVAQKRYEAVIIMFEGDDNEL